MDRNFLLAMVLSMGIFTLWASWKSSQMPPPSPTSAVEEVTAAEAEGGAFEAAAAEVPQPSDAVIPARPARPAGDAEVSPPRRASVAAWTRSFVFEQYQVTLTNVGAGLTSWKLFDYTEPTDSGPVPLEILSLLPERTALSAALLTPFRELGLGDLSLAHFEVEQESNNAVTFAYRSNDITVRKIYSFGESPYTFHLIVEVQNDSDEVVPALFELVWPVAARNSQDFKAQALAARSDGSVERGMIGGAGPFGGGSLDEEDRFGAPIDWFGVDTTYFIAALAPAQARATVIFEPVEKGVAAANHLLFPRVDIAPGQGHKHELRGYIGPKTSAQLEEFGADLSASVGRGWSFIQPLKQFFGWLLRACYSVVPNYGVAIIVLTLLVRLATWPILQRQMKSMEKMRAVQPQLKALQEEFSDDKQKQSEAMMRLYKENGVNPLGGCLPMVLQMPVFIGLFYALQSAIELRQAGFVGWITDLSAPETLFVIPGLDLPFRLLPVLMAGSMILQQKLQPTAMDPSQAKMMMTLMPVMMLFIFYSFPSGLVLYYMLSNMLGIGHQLWVGRKMREAEN